jgi:high-affinity Fe2+/Pb2+ permease
MNLLPILILISAGLFCILVWILGKYSECLQAYREYKEKCILYKQQIDDIHFSRAMSRLKKIGLIEEI